MSAALLKSVKTLVFAGGGVRGLAFVGALQELRDSCGIDFGAHHPKLDTVSGVSVGTLFALMICIGYNVAEITSFASSMRQSDVLSTDPVRILSGELSFDDGSKLRQQVETILIKKGLSKDVTLSQMRDLTKIKFHCLITDLTTASVRNLDSESYPDLKVSTAMVASMSVPVVYPPTIGPDGHSWVDGGLLENFPMMRFDPNTLLGLDFKVSSKCEIKTLVHYVSRVLHVQAVPQEVASWNLMSSEHQNRSIIIDPGPGSSLGLDDMSAEDRLGLLASGRSAVKRKIQEWDGKDHDHTYDPHFGKMNLPSYLASLKTCRPLPKAHD